MKTKLKYFTAATVLGFATLGAVGMNDVLANPFDTGDEKKKKELKENTVEKRIEITEENGETTMKVTTIENGMTTVDIYKGDEIQQFMKEEHGAQFFQNGQGIHAQLKSGKCGPGQMPENCHIVINGDVDEVDGESRSFHIEINQDGDQKTIDFDLDPELMKQLAEMREMKFEGGEMDEEAMRAKIEEMMGKFRGMHMEMDIDTDGEGVKVMEWNGDDGEQVHSRVMVVTSEGEAMHDINTILDDLNIEVNVDVTEGEDGKTFTKQIIITKVVTIEDVDKKFVKTGELTPESRLELTDLSFFPNPNDGQFTLQYEAPEAGQVEVRINDLSGKEVFRTIGGNGSQQLDVDISDQANGVYLLNLQQGSKSISKKIVIGK